MPIQTRERLLELTRSFQAPRILLTAAELDVFTRLASDALSAAELAGQIQADPRALTILLDALAGLNLLTKRDGKYACAPDMARYLSANSSDSVLPMVLHSAGLWPKWSLLTEIVKGRALPLTGQRSPEGWQAFIGAMAVVGAPLAASIAAAAAPTGAKRLIDVAGGPGTYTQAFLEAAPDMQATLFELPHVLEMARESLTRAGVAGRVSFVSGDFYHDELPGGHDLALLSAIIHQNSPRQNVDLYRKILRALDRGGRLIIRDHVLQPDRTRPTPAAVFAINMLVATESGNCYTFEEIRSNLEEAGFERVRLIQQSDEMASLVEAFRPA